jgi:hypothetical protein
MGVASSFVRYFWPATISPSDASRPATTASERAATRTTPRGHRPVAGRLRATDRQSFKNGIELSGGEWQKIAIARA